MTDIVLLEEISCSDKCGLRFAHEHTRNLNRALYLIAISIKAIESGSYPYQLVLEKVSKRLNVGFLWIYRLKSCKRQFSFCNQSHMSRPVLKFTCSTCSKKYVVCFLVAKIALGDCGWSVRFLESYIWMEHVFWTRRIISFNMFKL